MRYKCIVEYDGANYFGFQVQDNLDTIELEIEKALEKLTSKFVKIYPSGRTDRGVHALGQVIHFDLENQIPESGLKKGLNSLLPSDIYIKDVTLVDDSFHARFSAKSKEYHYIINIKEYSPFKARYMPYISYLNYDLMNNAIKLFIGTHDFKGFADSSIDERKDTIKTIFDAYITKTDATLEFVFIGTGFLKYQIRRMMGALVDIGRGYLDSSIINKVLEKKDPKISHRVMDGCGLYLVKVNY